MTDHTRDPPPERSALRAQRRDGGGRSLWTHLGNPGSECPAEVGLYSALLRGKNRRQPSSDKRANYRKGKVVLGLSAVLSQCKPCNSDCEENLHPRLFLCGRCRQQVRICRRCDRGQMYCGRECALEERSGRQREARRRYQASERGRQMHADRSRQYRARRRRVTDQGPILRWDQGRY